MVHFDNHFTYTFIALLPLIWSCLENSIPPLTLFLQLHSWMWQEKTHTTHADCSHFKFHLTSGGLQCHPGILHFFSKSIHSLTLLGDCFNSSSLIKPPNNSSFVLVLSFLLSLLTFIKKVETIRGKKTKTPENLAPPSLLVPTYPVCLCSLPSCSLR